MQYTYLDIHFYLLTYLPTVSFAHSCPFPFLKDNDQQRAQIAAAIDTLRSYKGGAGTAGRPEGVDAAVEIVLGVQQYIYDNILKKQYGSFVLSPHYRK